MLAYCRHSFGEQPLKQSTGKWIYRCDAGQNVIGHILV